MDFDHIRKELISGNAVLLDVREQEEWNQMHLALARLFPLSELEKGMLPADVSDKKIYIHCRRGRRAEEAARLLKKTNWDVTPITLTIEELQKMNF